MLALDLMDVKPINNGLDMSLTAFYQAAISTSLPVALWRPPHDRAHTSADSGASVRVGVPTAMPQALVDFSGQATLTKINFEQDCPGFAFAPFLNAHGSRTRFLKANLWFNQDGIQSLIEPKNERELQHQAQFWQAYQDWLIASYRPTWQIPSVNQSQNVICHRADFCTLVDKAVHYIHQNPIQKIVASRVTETELPYSFDPIQTFEALRQRYPQAFISLVAIPGIGTWLGATPETLLCIENDHCLRTVALAGTRPMPTSQKLADVQWGPKEIEEQSLVSDYIRTFFQTQHLSQVTETGPQTIQAGNVAHLCSDFKVNLTQPSLSVLANQILDKLHPTSAVCGMPKTEALNFILGHENYNRRFYSGFLGPMHLQGQSHLFVNLRCMQLKAHRALLYVGAGITKDSIPEAEWDETVLKSNTLLNVLYELA